MAARCFRLSADVKIREATANWRRLQDALRAMLAGSNGARVEWPIERVLAVDDAATGTDVLARLYAANRDRPVTTGHAALWSRLGISIVDGRTRFDAARRASGGNSVRRAGRSPG